LSSFQLFIFYAFFGIVFDILITLVINFINKKIFYIIAKQERNIVTQRMSGKIGGIVFRQGAGKTVIRIPLSFCIL
jgi:hypothetical protein